MTRPDYTELQCPKCKTYDSFRAIYARETNRYKKIGRMCQDVRKKGSYGKNIKGCGHIVIEDTIEKW